MLIINTTSRLKKVIIDLMRQINSGLHRVVWIIFHAISLLVNATILIIDIDVLI